MSVQKQQELDDKMIEKETELLNIQIEIEVKETRNQLEAGGSTRKDVTVPTKPDIESTMKAMLTDKDREI